MVNTLLEASLNPYSAGVDCSRQNLSPYVNPHTVRIKIFVLAIDT